MFGEFCFWKHFYCERHEFEVISILNIFKKKYEGKYNVVFNYDIELNFGRNSYSSKYVVHLAAV